VATNSLPTTAAGTKFLDFADLIDNCKKSNNY
jgi:hypothetical protein